MKKSKLRNVLYLAIRSFIGKEDFDALADNSFTQELMPGEVLPSGSIYLIVEGTVSVLNPEKELIRSYCQGFLGLDNVFVEKPWQLYKFVCDSSLTVLKFDPNYFCSIVVKYKPLNKLFRRQVMELDLMLLHYQATPKLSLNRIDLTHCIEQLKQIWLEPGIIATKSLPKGTFFILYFGSLVHDSGKEVTPGRAYSYTEVDPQSEWIALGGCCLYVCANEEPTKPRNLNTEENNIKTIDTILVPRSETLDYQRDRIFPSPKIHENKIWSTAKLIGIWCRYTNTYPFCLEQRVQNTPAACLKMVSLYWGKNLGYKSLQQKIGQIQPDASLNDLLELFEQFEFNISVGRADFAELTSKDLPLIVHWRENRYVVVYEIGKEKVVLNDPLSGRLELRHAKFCRFWSGYAFWVSPF